MSASFARAVDAAVGLSLAAAICAAWLALHFYGLLVFDLGWASLPLGVALAALLCWLSVGLFIVSHDAMHGSLAPGHRRLNRSIGAVLLFLYAGFAWKRMRDAHFAHHRHVGTARDPDFDADHPRSFWRWYGTFLARYFGWRSLAWVHLVVGVYWFGFDVPIAQIVLLYGAPAIASSLQLFYFGTFRPHRHGDDRFVDAHRARSDDFGALASFLTCFHFGYHLEHHRRPHLPWWALPAARREAMAPRTRGAQA